MKIEYAFATGAEGLRGKLQLVESEVMDSPNLVQNQLSAIAPMLCENNAEVCGIDRDGDKVIFKIRKRTGERGIIVG